MYLFEHDECLDCDARMFDHRSGQEVLHCDCGEDLDKDGQCPRKSMSTGTRHCSDCFGAGTVNKEFAVTFPPRGISRIPRVFEADTIDELLLFLDGSGCVSSVGMALQIGVALGSLK